VLKSATTIADFLLDTRRGWSLCSKWRVFGKVKLYVQHTMCCLLRTKCKQNSITGRLLATCGGVIVKGCETHTVKPDIYDFRKSNFRWGLSSFGSFGKWYRMNVIQPGQHGSYFEEIYCCSLLYYCRLSRKDENLAQNAAILVSLKWIK
jgi:hypothetical protein